MLFGLVCAGAAQTGIPSGIDLTAIDATCKPCDNFWQYANGNYVKTHPIPAKEARWGTFSILRDANAERVKVLLEAAAANPSAAGNEKLVGDFYAGCMNTRAIEAVGYTPLSSGLRRISAIRNRSDVVAELAARELAGDLNPVRIAGIPDPDDATNTITQVSAAGLSLPERDYYLRDDERSKQIRAEFLDYVTRIFELSGDAPTAASAAAALVLEFETVFAKATLTNVERRDPYKRVHKVDFTGLRQLAPDYDWTAVFRNLNIPVSVAINVTEPAFLKVFNAQLKDAPVDTWKVWLRWRLEHERAPLLSKPFYDAWFHFQRGVLTGVTEQQPRWQVCSREADARLGDALGKLYVEKHFPPAARERMMHLIENLRTALGEQLQNAKWLEPETKVNAIRKLKAFEPLIGYPDRWRDLTAASVSRGSYEASAESAQIEERRYRLAEIGHKVKRRDMTMSAPTVNASYGASRNTLTFPAGILQPPFFNPDADDAVNYGAIGAVIGHEMGHGFDDQGSKYDAEGKLKNWWTDVDRRQFETRAACVTDEFEAFDTGGGLHHKGKLVTGEAMGDLGGLTLAYSAYHKSLNGKTAPVLDGFTGDQRFFLAFARVWAEQSRPENERLQLNTDPHPLARFRANGTLQNMPEFHAAFGCKEGDPMVRPAAQRCRLW